MWRKFHRSWRKGTPHRCCMLSEILHGEKFHLDFLHRGILKFESNCPGSPFWMSEPHIFQKQCGFGERHWQLELETSSLVFSPPRLETIRAPWLLILGGSFCISHSEQGLVNPNLSKSHNITVRKKWSWVKSHHGRFRSIWRCFLGVGIRKKTLK